LAVKANQPSLRDEVERFFADAPPEAIDRHFDLDKGHGRIEDRRVFVSRDIDWLNGQRRFPGEHRFPGVAASPRSRPAPNWPTAAAARPASSSLRDP
jgi:hypothetical protein